MEEPQNPQAESPPPTEQSPEPKGRGVSLRELMLVCALLAIVAAMLMPSYWRAQERRDVARAKSNMRSMATAIEAYCVDWMTYPACGLAEGPPRYFPDGSMIPYLVPTVHSHLPVGSGARRTITFGVTLHSLSTPVMYIQSYYPDSFADTRGATFGYYVESHYPWIMWSVGPDRDENASDGPGDLGPVVEKVFSRDLTEAYPVGSGGYSPPPDLIYDASNGLRSNGDLIRSSRGTWPNP